MAGSAFALALEQACRLSDIAPMPSIQDVERDASMSTQENLGWSFGLMTEGGAGGLQVPSHSCWMHAGLSSSHFHSCISYIS